MKKIIIIVVVLIILGGGYYFYTTQKEEPVQENTSTSGKSLVVKENKTLMGWLRRGKAVECTISAPEGQIVAQTKDFKVRIEGEDFYSGEGEEAEKGVFINDGEYVYIWSGMEGMKINIKEMESMADDMSEEEETYSWTDTVDAWESAEYEYDCQEKNLSDELFIPPQEVNFIDFTDFTKGLGEMTESMESLGDDYQEGLDDMQNMTQEEIEAKLEEMDIDLNQLKDFE
jgi:hypothetical protein